MFNRFNEHFDPKDVKSCHFELDIPHAYLESQYFVYLIDELLGKIR